MARRARRLNAKLPLPLERLSSDEYSPPPYHPKIEGLLTGFVEHGTEMATRLSIPISEYWTDRRGTAAALLEIDKAWGGGFYNVPEEAMWDEDAADEALGGDQLVIDVQTHYISDRPGPKAWALHTLNLGESVAPDRFRGLPKLLQSQYKLGYSLAEYLRCVFLESDTAVAILTSGPGVEGEDVRRQMHNTEMAGTRELIDRLAGSGRFLNHTMVHPNVPGEIDKMESFRDQFKPVGWKVYTKNGVEGEGLHKTDYPQWWLDDDKYGEPFLQRARDLGVKLVCVHKGISRFSKLKMGTFGPSSPRDVGPAAKKFPDINFVIYHSGYEPRMGYFPEEGPYTEETADFGVNRLVKSLKDAGVGPGQNVYAEIGTTWYLIMAHPVEAAHVLGKLLLSVGENNVLWGTDCIFYGPPQPLIDVFRAFQIPKEFCQRYGYPELTPALKEKILGLNAARVYGVDMEKAQKATLDGDIAWVKGAMEEYAKKGMPTAD